VGGLGDGYGSRAGLRLSRDPMASIAAASTSPLRRERTEKRQRSSAVTKHRQGRLS